MFQTAILLAGTVFCLLGCFAGLSLYGKRIASPDTFSPVPVIIFCVVVLIASAAAFLYEWQDYDFVSDLSAASFAAAGTATVVLLVCSFLRIPGWFRLLLIAALSSVIVFFFSATITFLPQAPSWVNALLTVALWTVLSFALRLLGSNSALPGIELASVCFGAFLLWIISVLPAAVGTMALFMAVAAVPLIAWSWYPSKLRLPDASLDVLGFLLGWIVVFSSAEGTFSCFYIFMLYLLIEIFWALGKKFTFLPSFSDIRTNPAYYRAELSGLSPALINGQIIRINFLLVMFGCFQAFAPNGYSVPLFCTLLVIWQIYRLLNWNASPDTLKQANKEFIGGLKQNIDSLKNSFQKTDNRK